MKFNVGDIVEWAFNDGLSFVGFIASINKEEFAVTWFGNNGQTTYGINVLKHIKRVSQ